MNVREMILLLQTFDGETKVLMHGDRESHSGRSVYENVLLLECSVVYEDGNPTPTRYGARNTGERVALICVDDRVKQD